MLYVSFNLPYEFSDVVHAEFTLCDVVEYFFEVYWGDLAQVVDVFLLKKIEEFSRLVFFVNFFIQKSQHLVFIINSFVLLTGHVCEESLNLNFSLRIHQLIEQVSCLGLTKAWINSSQSLQEW